MSPIALLACAMWVSMVTSPALGAPEPAFAESEPVPGLTEVDRINLERNLRWILARERAGTPANARVGVFADAGVWHIGARSIVDALEGAGVPCRVLDRSMLEPKVLGRLEAVILPGGWAPFEWAAAGPDGLEALRDYVHGGGRCLGICAGAYLMSRDVHYEGKRYPYPLGLFDGSAKGPVPGLAAFPAAGPARLVPTKAGAARGLAYFDGQDVYYSGGPCFEGGTDVTVLARFADGTVAAVARSVGKGEVVLVGVHIERPAPADGGDGAPPPSWAGRALRSLLFPESR